ncbi:MAG: hypothetical protein LPJ96_03930 [Exiguobacterium sp.]|uniref:Uncharacterized protein n=1 Tax=Exiguobacterium alkaliphilum TaxID=1428684 RepID=A0ABT2L0R2_9BACL|nr:MULTISPECIES: hypothetical protein [Exiguobacterium]MCT4796304.1 hypothetical protein [Exiguobacterium alkaliphilum]MDX5322737.1 hypothetical protein [Exiguobacterium sp.]MDX5424481.1 hypothetical protein [Exiguobacterium sp.]MDX6771982.1 hypothetical protein [Exiguobacterium sp.]
MQKRWVDDMLDLYNAAKRLGDDTWAHTIMKALEAGYEASELNEQERKQTILEKRLMEIDARLHELRKQFEHAESVKSRQQLYEQAIKLQVERAQIEEERKRHHDSINST